MKAAIAKRFEMGTAIAGTKGSILRSSPCPSIRRSHKPTPTWTREPIRNNFNALKTLIDALPASPPPTLKSGDGNLDGSGVLDISGATSATFAIGSWYNSTGTGRIYTLGAPLRIASDAGAADVGLTVCWISF